MALAHHYRILGLRTGAGFDAVKLAYRNLARLYHPDVNPGDHLAKEKFIQVTQAYQALAEALPHEAGQAKATTISPVAGNATTASPSAPRAVESSPQIQQPPGGSDADQDLKQSSFEQLQAFFRSQRYPRAIALVEGLAHRFPNDPEVRQWHAITYYRWGHDSLNTGNLKKAEACLKKAWRLDPHNRSLQQSLQQDWQRLAQLRQAPLVQSH